MNEWIICPRCQENKPLYALGRCRSCYEKHLKETNPEYAERQRENTRIWSSQNKNQKQQDAKKRQTDPALRARDARTKRLNALKKIGLDEQKLESLIVLQNGKCAICQRPLSRNRRAVHIDHDHTTGCARGVLCSRCNNGLGMLGDDLAGIEQARAYLSNPPGATITGGSYGK